MKIEITTEPLIAGTVTVSSVICIAAISILSKPESSNTATAAIVTITALT